MYTDYYCQYVSQGIIGPDASYGDAVLTAQAHSVIILHLA